MGIHTVEIDTKVLHKLAARTIVPGIPAVYKDYKLISFDFHVLLLATAAAADSAVTIANACQHYFDTDAIILWINHHISAAIGGDAETATFRAICSMLLNERAGLPVVEAGQDSNLGTDIGYRKLGDRVNSFKSGLWIPMEEADLLQLQIYHEIVAPVDTPSRVMWTTELGFVEK